MKKEYKAPAQTVVHLNSATALLTESMQIDSKNITFDDEEFDGKYAW